MKTQAVDGKWKITLDRECTIMEIEQDLRKLRRFPKTIKSVEIDTEKLREMDTAYFQMLLSLRESAIKSRVEVIIKDDSPILAEFSELYGYDITANNSNGGPLKN